METIKRGISKVYQRVLAMSMALVMLVGILPAFELGASAAESTNILDYYTEDVLRHRLSAGQKVKMEYFYSDDGDPVADRIRGGYLSYDVAGNKK
jgi:hypothetical protein